MEKIVRVDRWNPDEKDKLITFSGKIMNVAFDEILDCSDVLNTFFIVKDVYSNKLGLIVKYINYFNKFYDNDHELILDAYKVKFIIDNISAYPKLPEKTFIKILYDILITDSIIDKVDKMVEDNYYISLESKNNNKYDKSLEFNDGNGKTMMKMSTLIKIMVPLINHYSKKRNIKKPDYFKYFENMIIKVDKKYEVYNKIYMTILKRVNRHYVINEKNWKRNEILLGLEPEEFIETTLKYRIICDNMFKYVFSNNPHNLNIAVIKRQLGYVVRNKFDLFPTEITHQKDGEGLSAIDRLVLNMNKEDESLIILSEISVKNTLKKIKRRFNISVSDEELYYYYKNHRLNKFLMKIVFAYYAKFFDGYNDLYILPRKQYIELMIILKKKMIYDGFLYLPQILSSNTEKLNSRVIRNNKFLTLLEGSETYDYIINDKYDAMLELVDDNEIIKLLSQIVNSKFSYVDYNLQDKLGDPIEINQIKLTDEFQKFLLEI